MGLSSHKLVACEDHLSQVPESLTVCCWLLVLSSKKCGYHIMEVMPQKTPYSHKNHPIFLGPTELMGEKMLGGIHGNVH